ncbi:MAG TPA: T9SS type A sorting domain-containing protein, partial [Bacteroidia bacterium]|nr:T9SS type A sorting domain-containing protein [Bacteroidia bacterium]HNU34957.1 T9SS type A sorting domain-containing protein [Bacteroidia bacterium]
EGVVGGILISGNKCEVSGCEIYGFPSFGILVRDMVDPARTDQCCNLTLNERGEVTIRNNYIHNCKGNGWAYGMYISQGTNGTFTSTVCPLPPPPIPNMTFTQYAFTAPDEVAHISNNILFENKHDIDCSSAGLSMNIFNNTFGQRNQAYNLHMHNMNESYLCNPVTLPGCHPPLGIDQTFWDIGGRQTLIQNNIFYTLGETIGLRYPNTNPLGNAPIYNYYTAYVGLRSNYFKITPELYNFLGHNNLFWKEPLNCYSGLDGHSYKIRIMDVEHYNFDLFADPNIYIDEASHFKNHVGALPFPPSAGVPEAVIASIEKSNFVPGAIPNELPKFIKQGETIMFSTASSTDKNGNFPPDPSVINSWRFNEDRDNLLTEIRTDNTNAATSFLPYEFNEIGINNVTLMMFDPQSTSASGNIEWSASDIAKQLITVKPHLAEREMWLSFWIKDSFIGGELNGTGLYGNGVEDAHNPNPRNTSPTGFEKFFRILNDDGNVWKECYVDDIEGDEGWEHVTFYLGDMLGEPVPPIFTIEIGLRAVTDVDAERVKGVSFEIDDVYINSPTGSNLVKNGDMETPQRIETDPHKQFYFHGLNWTETPWPFVGHPFNKKNCSQNAGYTYSDEGMSLSTDEVRSGLYSYMGWVKPVSKDEYEGPLGANAGTHYVGDFIYKSITQRIEIDGQLSARITSMFTIQPNPSAPNKQLLLLPTNDVKGTCYFELYNPQGNLVLKDEFAGKEYMFNSPIAPGIYLAKLLNNHKMSYQKVVVAN